MTRTVVRRLTERGINLHGSYPFNRPDLGGGLRALCDPDTIDNQE